MKRKTKLFILSAGLILSCFSATTAHAATNTINNIDVLLEQQENKTNDKIRYISTLELSNGATLQDITKIDMELSLSKAGETTLTTEREIFSVYDTVSGSNGKAKVANTYYSVFTITDVAASFPGWNLSATFEYNYSDGTSEETNTVNYTIPETYTLKSSGNGEFITTSECFADSVQDGQILQCFCWSYNEIMEYLSDIAAQGFTAIQTSPVQVCKEATVGQTAKGSWWAYYQPAAFTIDDTGDNALGTPEEFQAMCQMAHSYGVKVLVDVVANHLGNQWVADSLCERAYYYEWEIAGMDKPYSEGGYIPYTGEVWAYGGGKTTPGGVNASTTKVIDTYHYKDTFKFHPYLVQDNDEPGNVVKGNIGMMDLDTSDPVVQDAVADYLEELISYGVDGFRFDAAKHIETPKDGDLASDFWPNVMERAEAAAASAGRDLYAYGEILNRPGNGRSLSGYTDYNVAITDSGLGHNIVENGGSSHGSFNGADGNDYADYKAHMVTWAESHDNYMGTQDTHNKSETVINRAYAILASRKDFATLYCARFKDYEKSKLGEVACLNGWSYASVGAVNMFHNFYSKTKAEEDCYTSGSYTVTERYVANNSTANGIVLVGNAGPCSFKVNHMADGTYKDYVTGNTFTVSNGVLSGVVGSEEVAVVYNNTLTTQGSCSISASAKTTFYTATMDASFTIRNASSATLTIDGHNHSITSGATVSFGYDMKVGDTKTITVKAIDKDGKTVTQSFTYTKVAAPKTYTVHFAKPDEWSNLYAYLYPTANSTPDRVDMLYDSSSSSYFVEYEETYQYVAFGNGENRTVLIPLTNEDTTYQVIPYDGYVYFDNTASWTKVYAYMWLDKKTNNAKWPGVVIEKDTDLDLYRVDPEGYTYIIFNNNSAQTSDLTIYTDYSYVYNASSYTGIRVEEIDICEHNYTNPTWTWEGYTSAKLSFTCTNCNKKITKDANITSEVTVPATTTSTGTKVYTATVTMNGNTYTDAKSETLPMIDLSVTTVERVEATCETAGNILYYIKNGKYYTDYTCSNEISLSDTIIPATGHHYALTITGNSYVYGCTNCNDGAIEIEGIKIHYNGNTSTYTDIWFWTNALNGANYAISSTDSYGKYATITTENFGGLTKLGFIVKNDKWKKDHDADRFVDINYLVPDDEGYYHIYLQTGSGTIYLDASQQTIYTEA